MKKLLITVPLTGLMLAGCYYDNEEELYPCSMLNITYTNTIKPLLESRCYTCHTGASAPYGLDLTQFSIVKRIALHDTLYRAVIGDGMTKMPADGTSLSPCEISRIKAWQDAGAPE